MLGWNKTTGKPMGPKKSDPKTNQIKQVKEINKTLEETKIIMEKNVDGVIERGKKIERLKDKSGEMVKNSKKFNKDAEKFSRWVQYKQYRTSAVMIGLIIGTLYGVFSGFAWPMVIATAILGAGAGYGVSWIASNIMRTLDMFRFWDASPESKTLIVKHTKNKSTKDLTCMQELALAYRPLYERKKRNRVQKDEEFEQSPRKINRLNC